MKTKRLFILLTALITLASCSKQGVKENVPSLIAKELFTLNLETLEDDAPFSLDLSKSLTKDNSAFFYTFTFKYKNNDLNNLKIVIVPSYASEIYNEAYQAVGYNNSLSLKKNTNKGKNEFNGINVSYISKKDTSFYVNVTSDFENNKSFNFKVSFEN